MFTMNKYTLLGLLCTAYPLLGHTEGLLAIDNPANNGFDTRIYASAEAFEGNDQVAMRQYGGDWQGAYSPRNGTNLGLLAARTEAGVQWQGYRLGVLYRADALVQANRDTSDLVQQYASRTGYDIGQTYPLGYQLKGFEAVGAHLSKSFHLNTGDSWQIAAGLGVSYLRGQRVKIETATGQVVTINTKDFSAAASRNTSDSTLDVNNFAQFNAPSGRLAAPSGAGYAVDAGLVAHHQGSGATLEVSVADLAGRIDWTDLPSNATVYNNATKYYDTNGYVQFNPLATRTSSYQNLTQQFDPKLRLAASYPLGNFELKAATDYTQGFWFAQTGIGYHVDTHWTVYSEFDWRFNTLGLSVRHDWFYVTLRTDNVDLGAAKAYGLNAGLQLNF